MKTLKLITAILLLQVVNNCYSQQTLSWASYTSSSLTYSATSSCVTMNSSVTTSGTPNWQAPLGPSSQSPNYINTLAAGTGLRLFVNWTNTSSSVTLKIDFTSAGSPIGTTASFSIFNVNATIPTAGSKFIDSVRIQGTTLANTTINPTSMTSDPDNQLSNPIAKGHSNGAADNPEITTNVTFSSPIKRITITYLSGKQFVGTTTPNSTDPTTQWITIGSITTNYTGGACAPLPIELTSFNASCLGPKTKLEWTTNSEINNANFTLEKSNDASYFHTIGIVEGAGNSNQPIQYYFDDNEQSGSENYYRLKQTDFDGNYSYSNVITSICENSFNTLTNISIYPNPIQSLLNINFEEAPLKNLTISIYNSSGQIIYSYKNYFLESVYQINTQNFAPGVYYLKINTLDQSELFSKKLIIVNR